MKNKALKQGEKSTRKERKNLEKTGGKAGKDKELREKLRRKKGK